MKRCPLCGFTTDEDEVLFCGNDGTRLVENPEEKFETKEIFDTIRDAEKKYNLSRSCIAYAIKHNGTSAGYHWEYV